jgi:hypothetical protein
MPVFIYKPIHPIKDREFKNTSGNIINNPKNLKISSKKNKYITKSSTQPNNKESLLARTSKKKSRRSHRSRRSGSRRSKNN